MLRTISVLIKLADMRTKVFIRLMLSCWHRYFCLLFLSLALPLGEWLCYHSDHFTVHRVERHVVPRPMRAGNLLHAYHCYERLPYGRDVSCMNFIPSIDLTTVRVWDSSLAGTVVQISAMLCIIQSRRCMHP